MTLNGPTEEDPNYIADTGASPQDMQDQVAAYRSVITAFNEAVYAEGGFTCAWQRRACSAARVSAPSCSAPPCGSPPPSPPPSPCTSHTHPPPPPPRAPQG